MVANAYICPQKTNFSASIPQELADRLVAAVHTHPTITTAAHACGVSIALLRNWIRRGSQADAPPELADFAGRFAAAHSEVAAKTLAQFKEQVAEGNKAAGHTLKYMNQRFRDREAADVEDMITGSAKKTDSLEKLLLKPTPRLMAILDKCGWMSKPGFTHGASILAEGTEVDRLPAGE